MDLLKLAWKKWKAFGKKVADFQSRVLLTFFYYILLLPVGLGVKIFGDRLKIKSSSQVNWTDWDPESDTLEQIRRQG